MKFLIANNHGDQAGLPGYVYFSIQIDEEGSPSGTLSGYLKPEVHKFLCELLGPTEVVQETLL
jgi:hypothetical protein